MTNCPRRVGAGAGAQRDGRPRPGARDGRRAASARLRGGRDRRPRTGEHPDRGDGGHYSGPAQWAAAQSVAESLTGYVAMDDAPSVVGPGAPVTVVMGTHSAVVAPRSAATPTGCSDRRRRRRASSRRARRCRRSRRGIRGPVRRPGDRVVAAARSAARAGRPGLSRSDSVHAAMHIVHDLSSWWWPTGTTASTRSSIARSPESPPPAWSRPHSPRSRSRPPCRPTPRRPHQVHVPQPDAGPRRPGDRGPAAHPAPPRGARDHQQAVHRGAEVHVHGRHHAGPGRPQGAEGDDRRRHHVRGREG